MKAPVITPNKIHLLSHLMTHVRSSLALTVTAFAAQSKRVPK